MDELTDLARELVAIPSHDSEAAAGDRIEEWLRAETDAAVARDDAGSDGGRGGNVIARRRPPRAVGTGDDDGSGGEIADESGGAGVDDAAASRDDGDASGIDDRPTLAFVGHHDVVPPDDSQTDGEEYVVSEEDGRLYGRGSADMKGAVAAMMLAFRDADLGGEAARGSGTGPDGGTAGDGADPDDRGAVPELVFASFVGEEVGGVGCRAAIEAGFAPDVAVVGEGSTGYSLPDGADDTAAVTDVAVAHKGRRGSTVVADGAASHASEPEAGDNAVYRACDAVDVVRELAAPTVEVLGESLSGSVVVTEIDGGTAMNVVPDRCTATVDERTVPGERAPLDRVEGIDGVSLRIDQDLPPMRCGDEGFADAVLAAARDVEGNGGAEHVVKPHATDAGWLADRAGTDPVICGPAEPGEAHTESESVSLDVLERCYGIYRGVARRYRPG